MCGVVGVVALGKQKSKIKATIMEYLFTEILQATEERGKDATGVSALFRDGMSIVQKGSVTAAEFIGNLGKEETTYNSFINNCRSHVEEADTALQLYMGHCRKSSVGGAFDNVNNHPIKVNEIVGVHNGTLLNHNIIFRTLEEKRDGVVDTEAIMQLLNYYTNKCKEPFTLDGLTEVARRLEGSFSVLAYNANNPFQICFMRKERPLEMAMIKDLGIFLISSDKAFFTRAIYQYNKYAALYSDGLPIINTDVVEAYTFPLDHLGILDLNVELEEDTVILDIIKKSDFFKCNKIWQTPTVQKTTYVQQHSGKKNDAEKPKETPDTTKGTSTQELSKIDGTTSKGKVFCRKLGGYVPAELVKNTAKLGPRIFNIRGGEILNIDNKTVDKENSSKELIVYDKNVSNSKISLDKVSSFPIKANEEAVPIYVDDKNISTPKITLGKTITEEVQGPPLKIMETTKAISVNEVKVVDDALVEIMKAADEYSKKIPCCSRGIEAAEVLGITNVDNLDEVPAHIIVNKARLLASSEAFTEGAMWAKKNLIGENIQKVVRVTKHVVSIFGSLITKLAKNDSSQYKPFMQSELDKLGSGEITINTMQKVFSKGNLIENPPLKVLEDLVNE